MNLTALNLTALDSADGVSERSFTLGDVTGVLWSPTSGPAGAPLILLGHSGGMDKRSPGVLARAAHYVAAYGFTVAAIDAPGHGDRPRNERDRQWVDELRHAQATGEPILPVVTAYNASLAERAAPEWQATIDALQALSEIGPDAPIGYGGMTLGAVTGLTLAAREPRIGAVQLGGLLAYDALVEAAARVTVPVDFLVAWDDEVLGRRPGLAMFEACGSTEKALHAYPGRYDRLPRSTIDDSARFFRRHLATGAAAA